MTDVGTTPRKPLTPRERLKLFEEHKGICGLCGLPIMPGEKWRDEHMRALGLGGSNEKSNRAPVHIKCAEVKDGDDIPRIAKAKRQKMAELGIKREGPKIANRGFPKKPKREQLQMPPRRPMFEDVK
jgi:5-methylcytosine-specific restriction protein A